MSRIPPPSNLRYPPHIQHATPLRSDEWSPEPLSGADWRELVYMVPAAIVCVAGVIAFCVIVFTLVPGPK